MQSADEKRLLADLASAGYEIPSVWLWQFRGPQPYLGAGEILAEHLAATENARLIDCLARLLAHPEFRFAVPTLIAKLEAVESSTSKHSIASALVKIGVSGHQDAVLRALERNETLAIKPLLQKALRNAGVDLSEYERQENVRQQAWLRPGFGIAILISGVATLVAVPFFWDRTHSLLLSLLVVYGAVEIALGALLLRRSSLALPTYVAFGGLSIAALIIHQTIASLFSLQLFLLILVVGLATLIYFGVLLFGSD